MKSIKEKEMLVKLAKSLGQDIDESIVQEVTEHKKFENNIRESIRSNIFEDLSKALADLKWAVSDTTIFINAPEATSFCPAVPSVLLSVTEVAL